MGTFNGKKSERQLGRVLAFIAQEARTIKQIAAGLHMGQTTARSLIRLLMGESPRRMYIAGWDESGTCPGAMYRAGTRKRDVAYVKIKDRPRMHPNAVEGQRKRALMLELLAMPQTSEQLGPKLGLRRQQTLNYLREHRKAGRVYIKGWVLPINTGSQSPVYALGSGPDKPRTRRSRQKAAYRCNQQPKSNAWTTALGI